MRPQSGLDLLRILKSDRRLAETPVLILTGDPLATAAAAARSAGAFALVEKPPTPGELRQRLESAINDAVA
jgi:CheY-like chemotaxis protein